MPELNKLGSHDQYTDNSLVQIAGPDNSKMGYQYDKQQRAFFIREASLIFSGKHGSTHVSTDPIPNATCTTPGLLAADDKCRLDALTATRIGVLGFQGAGFPDDGGFLQGDVILASGSEMISIERVGQVVRFVVDVPAVFTCGNEDCLQMYWLQDETDIAAIRPPITGGRLMGTNTYGELKVYVFPDNTIVNPANPSATLNNKGFYPTFIFKRYDDGTGANEAELDMVLKRNASGTAMVGWAFTPGATGKPEWQTFLGVDDDGNRITFKLDGNTTTGILGTLLYNGTTITKRPAIITSYDTSVITSNVYKAKWWDTQGKSAIGEAFSVTNQPGWDLTNNVPVLDSTSDSPLDLGQIVDILSIQVGTSNGNPVYVHYCREQPRVSTASLWTTVGAVEFGNILDSRDGAASSAQVNDFRTIESNEWGNTGLKGYNQLVGTTVVPINSAYDAQINTSIPALEVVESEGASGEKRRPVTIWNRASLRDAYLEVHLARPGPAADIYPPIDILLRAPIDAAEVKYASIASANTLTTGTYTGKTYVILNGVNYTEIPPRGLIRAVDSSGYGTSYAYIAVLRGATGQAVLVMNATAPANNTNIEFLHEEYKSPALRLQFQFANGSHDVVMQPQVGTLDPTASFDDTGAALKRSGRGIRRWLCCWL